MSRTLVATLVNNAVAGAVQGTGFTATDTRVAKATGAVVEAVDAGLDSALEALRQAARDLGATDNQVDTVFEAAGLNHDPEPVVETVVEEDEQAGEGFKAEVRRRLQALEDLAKRYVR